MRPKTLAELQAMIAAMAQQWAKPLPKANA